MSLCRQLSHGYGSRRWSAVALAGALAGALLLSATRPASAQRPQFEHLGTDDGLGSSWVQEIFQDSRGFMWFATFNGLNRYDGYRMELFRERRADTVTNIINHRVNTIFEDDAGILWMGHSVGLSRYDRAHDAWRNYKIADPSQRPSDHMVYSVVEDGRGTLWVGATGGLFSFDRATGQSVRFPLPATGAGEIARLVRVLKRDPRTGHLWIGTFGAGLMDFDPATRRIVHYQMDAANSATLPDNDVRSIVIDPRGVVWVATFNGGLAKLDRATGRFTRYRHDARDPKSLVVDKLRKIVWDRGDKGLWIGTEGGGVDFLDVASGEFRHTHAYANDPTALNSESIWALYQDPGGTLWAGTFDGGLNILKPGNGAMRVYRPILGDTTTISGSHIVGFTEDSAGAVWIATDGLNRLDRATGLVRRYTTANSALPQNSVLAVAAGQGNDLWVAGWGIGIGRLDQHTGRFSFYTSKNTNLPNDNIFAVHVDRKGRVWAGSWQDGLLRFDRATNRFTRYPLPVRAQTQVWLIRELRDGRLALGTLASGLAVFDPETEKFTRYDSYPNSPAALSSAEVRAVLEVEPNVLWVGTAAGLDRLDLRTNAISYVTEDDGLPSNFVSGLARDGAGALWVSTDNGVARFDPATKHVERYTTADGLQGKEFTARSYFQLRDGAMLFGGNNGFNLITPSLIAHNTRKPPVLITGFQLFNRPVPIGGEGSPLREHVTEARHITLRYDQSVFTFEFAALDFRAPSKNRYAYKLEGFDRDWTYAGTVRTATYTNLPPGEFVFHVKAANDDGVWNEAGRSIAITITPPYWMTWWFRSLVALALGGLALLAVRVVTRRRRALEAMNRKLADAAERDREAQQYLERNVLDILGAMQRFSGGDYSVALNVESEDAIGALRLGFNSVVADRKRAEEELRQSQKMEAVGRLAGGVAHDFNNLLTVIKGNAALAIADLDAKPSLREEQDLREELEEVERAAERAGGLTRQLLAFSRKQILQPRVLALNEIVTDLVRMLRRTVGEDIELRIVLDPELGRVRADPGQIEQVLLNLVVNARDAMPRGGTLTIETHNVDAREVQLHAEAERIPYVSLVVRDTGTGMPESVRERVFEPFFTTKEQGKGTGLGLSTVYGSVKQSGGYVHVESEEGLGSTFSVYLPLVVDAQQESAPIERAPQEPGTGTILLVEDEDALRRMASRVLERSGYTVISAPSGRAALEVAAAYDGTIDLLLTDVVMPGMSGRELAERLVPMHPYMRLLYASGYTEDAIVRHGVSSQSTAFLEKPFTPDALLRKVQQVFAAGTPSRRVELVG